MHTSNNKKQSLAPILAIESTKMWVMISTTDIHDIRPVDFVYSTKKNNEIIKTMYIPSTKRHQRWKNNTKNTVSIKKLKLTKLENAWC